MAQPYPPEQLANGRWISNGRQAALGCLDALLGEDKNIQTLRKALQVEFADDPVLFFKNIVMPLMPKSMLENQVGAESPEAKAEAIRSALEQLEKATAAVKAAGSNADSGEDDHA